MLTGDRFLKIPKSDGTFRSFLREVSNKGHSERKCSTVKGQLQE